MAADDDDNEVDGNGAMGNEVDDDGDDAMGNEVDDDGDGVTGDDNDGNGAPCNLYHDCTMLSTPPLY